MEIDRQQEKILAAIDAASEQVLSISRQIHDHPELGNQEFFASGLLVNTLKEHGFSVEHPYADLATAFCARRGRPSSPDSPIIAFLAEYDALPEIGHACGHNLIATAALSAGIGLGSVIDELDGQVWVVGTPAEETVGAKVHIAESGYLKEIDAALMIHPHTGNFYTTQSLALNAIQVDFYGKPAHAASAPWEGINALDALLLTFVNLNALRQHVTPDTRIHGIISKGGDAPNIIPEHTQGHFYVRARRRSYLDEVVERFYDCARAAAAATGCRVEFSKYEADFDDMVNNLTLASRVRDYLVDHLGSGPFGYAPDHFGSIDMGNVSHVSPAVHILIDIADGQKLTPHTRPFAEAAASQYAAQSMLRAGKALALTGYDVVTQPAYRLEIKEEFIKYLQGG